MRQSGASNRRHMESSSDMDLSSGEEDDRLEQMLSRHQQRNVSDWGRGDQTNSRASSMTRSERRDAKRDAKRRKRRDDLLDPDQSFEMDTKGATLPTPSVAVTSTPSSVKRSNGLLLPGHVEIQSDESEGEGSKDDQDVQDEIAEGELGDFVTLDADRSGQVARYYETEEQEQRKALEECPTCGEMGHDKKSCPHLQCLACGALDEHQTRECPMGLSCFRCGGRGHKAFECKLPRTQGAQGWNECQRCGATSHVVASCPTLWRIYTYNSLADHLTERRRLFKELETSYPSTRSTNKIGFDYRSESDSEVEEGEHPNSPPEPPRDWDPVERWCYNCAAQGNHWGDDCPLPRCNPTRRSGDPSAYSEFMSSMGPHSRYLPPPPPRDPDAYRNGIGRRNQFDRFEAGPGASMHVYDPQREAMASVDQLFDRHGPGASRRRDAAKRRGGREVEPSRRPKPVDRKSGQGSKADRYREMAREEESNNRRGPPDSNHSNQVSSTREPFSLKQSNPSMARVEVKEKKEYIAVTSDIKEVEGEQREGTVIPESMDLRKRKRPAPTREDLDPSNNGDDKVQKPNAEGVETRAVKAARLQQKSLSDIKGEPKILKEKKLRATEEERERRFDLAQKKGEDAVILREEREAIARAAEAKKAEKKRLARQFRKENREKKEAANKEKKEREKKNREEKRRKKEEAAKKQEKDQEMKLQKERAKKEEREEAKKKLLLSQEEKKKAVSTGKGKKKENILAMKQQFEKSQAALLGKGDVTKHAQEREKWQALEAKWKQKGLLVA